jgi:hypothetical protein
LGFPDVEVMGEIVCGGGDVESAGSPETERVAISAAGMLDSTSSASFKYATAPRE